MAKLDFKVTGRVEGQHRVQTEDGKILFLSDSELARHEREHNLLSTNEFDMRHGGTGDVAPGISTGGDEGLRVAFNAFKSEFIELAKAHAALEARVATLEVAADDKAEAQAKLTEKGK